MILYFNWGRSSPLRGSTACISLSLRLDARVDGFNMPASTPTGACSGGGEDSSPSATLVFVAGEEELESDVGGTSCAKVRMRVCGRGQKERAARAVRSIPSMQT